MTWPSKGLTPYPRPSLAAVRGHSHRKRPDSISVKELRLRLFNEQMFVRPIRQSVFKEGERPYLEQLDIYGRTTYLGRAIPARLSPE